MEKSEEERREAVRAKRRLKRQRKKAARAAAAVSSANKEQVADEAHQGSAGDAETAEPAVEGASTPRRTTTPTFERGHTGLTPPGKRQCLDAKDGDGVGVDEEPEMGRRLSIESVESMASDCTVFSDFGGDGRDGLQWQPGGDRSEAAANNSLLSGEGA